MRMHLVAHALPGLEPMIDPEMAWWLMGRLRLGFPTALAACIMPDHVHLIAYAVEPEVATTRLARILARVTVRLGLRQGFRPVPAPRMIPDRMHLERQVRYIHLNPCRAKLVRDPLRWPWSTHRGLVNAELDPWVDAAVLARALGRSVRSLAQSLHAYVSGDPSVNPGGSPLPSPCLPRDLATVPLESVRRAALAATPWSPPAVRKAQIVQLAAQQGWRDPHALARAAGLSVRSVWRILAAGSDPAALRPAQLCLGDARLLLPERALRPVAALPRARARSVTDDSPVL